LWWTGLTKDMQTEQLLCWSGMTDKTQSIQPTSGSNEAAVKVSFLLTKKTTVLKVKEKVLADETT